MHLCLSVQGDGDVSLSMNYHMVKVCSFCDILVEVLCTSLYRHFHVWSMREFNSNSPPVMKLKPLGHGRATLFLVDHLWQVSRVFVVIRVTYPILALGE